MTRLDSALEDLGRLDAFARRDTWAHRLDPRVKILVTLVFVVIVASFPPRAVSGLLPCFAYPLFMLVAGHVPLRILLRPLVLGLLLALAMGVANPYLDRELLRVGPGWSVAGGWLSLASIVVRTVLCIAAAVVLLATTGMERLSAGLARLGVPHVLVSQLLFVYRYLFLLGANSQSVSRARALRSCGKPLGLSTFGSMIGHLLLRTLDRAERIHQAMCCRGFRGTIPLGEQRALAGRDYLFLVGWCACLVTLRCLWTGAVSSGAVGGGSV